MASTPVFDGVQIYGLRTVIECPDKIRDPATHSHLRRRGTQFSCTACEKSAVERHYALIPKATYDELADLIKRLQKQQEEKPE